MVIATGGLSIPTLGASAFGYQIARQFGHNIINTYPALCPLTLTDKLGELLKNLSGISLDVEVSNSKITFNLPMLFTHKGLSGPAILQISNYWQLGESIFINLLPNINIADFLIKNKDKIDEILNSTSLQSYYKGREQKLFKDVLQLFMCGIRY